MEQTIAHALQFDGRRHFKLAGESMAKIMAAHLVRHLAQSGSVVMRRPPSEAPSDSPGKDRATEQHRSLCGRVAAQLPPGFIRRLCATTSYLPRLGPNRNVAPTRPAMVIRLHPETGEKLLDVLRWGGVPHRT